MKNGTPCEVPYSLLFYAAWTPLIITILSPVQILIVAPPHIGSTRIPDPLYHKFYVENFRMNTAFERMAGDKKVWFSDASQWNVELSFDQVHFSERGHKIFAERMAELLENILCLEKQAQKKRPI
jgi:lysophospholipase L1-like esterase